MKQLIAKLFGMHTERDLVSFGNFLIAQRATAMAMEAIENKLPLDKISTPKPVQHADLCNWAFEQSNGITLIKIV